MFYNQFINSTRRRKLRQCLFFFYQSAREAQERNKCNVNRLYGNALQHVSTFLIARAIKIIVVRLMLIHVSLT